MSKLFILAVLLLHSLVAQYAIARNRPSPNGGVGEGPEAVQKWFDNLPNAKEKLTKLHFYYHDIISGKNPTAVTIAKSNLTYANDFGVLRMMDDPLTVGPEADSKVIGRAQGLYGSTSLGELGLLMTLNHVFTDGEFKGSTLSILGHNPILHQYREIAIVGGSGAFRLARGVATAKTVWLNAQGDAVVEYNVFVLHY